MAYEDPDGVTIIPVANVMGGAGAGGGSGPLAPADAGKAPVAQGATPSGYGMGYGLRATPAGVYVIKEGAVEWRPALDLNRLLLQCAGLTVVALLVLRSIIRMRARP
jgi:uncharacterized spore protein YtfJ